MKIYLVFFALTVVMNVVYSAKIKVKIWTLLYEIFSGPFLIFLTVAYWVEPAKAIINGYIAIPFIIVISFDFYYTMWGKPEKLSDEFKNVNPKELEAAKAMSIAFTAPAYVTAALLCAELISK